MMKQSFSVGGKLNTISHSAKHFRDKSYDSSSRRISPLIQNYRKPADPDIIIPVIIIKNVHVRSIFIYIINLDEGQDN